MKEEEQFQAAAQSDRDDLVTERDIDEEFGLFQEGSYPAALQDDAQRAAVEHALPPKDTKDQ
ncbi:hypothetical protein [Paenibacillus tengchongensis]|uniref:hypothetical protein n=1 Tax=Paenibacillus tengchongensis TaxID=2608684 RepID=UPI00124E70DF|nr:hypothetical protein [Paenibacillus tengchongensis]